MVGFMVVFRHLQHLAMVGERLWSFLLHFTHLFINSLTLTKVLFFSCPNLTTDEALELMVCHSCTL